MKDTVYLVWYRDMDIYRSHSLCGLFKDKFDAIAKAKELARERTDDEVTSLEPGTKRYKRIKENYVEPNSKLIAAYLEHGLFTVEETSVE